MYRAAQDGEMSAKTAAIYNWDHSGGGARTKNQFISQRAQYGITNSMGYTVKNQKMAKNLHENPMFLQIESHWIIVFTVYTY